MEQTWQEPRRGSALADRLKEMWGQSWGGKHLLWNPGCRHLVLFGGRQELQEPPINNPSTLVILSEAFSEWLWGEQLFLGPSPWAFMCRFGCCQVSTGADHQQSKSITRQNLRLVLVFLPLSCSVRFRVWRDAEKWIWADILECR